MPPAGPRTASVTAASIRQRRSQRPKARENKRALVGYYSPDMCSAIKDLSRIEQTSIQALIGEALDMLLHERGYETFKER